MCTGSCAKCLGGTLIPFTVFGFLANVLLFFPGGRVIDDNDNLSDEVWFFGGILGSGVLMILPVVVFLGLKNNDCCGCCGNQSCGKRCAVSQRDRASPFQGGVGRLPGHSGRSPFRNCVSLCCSCLPSLICKMRKLDQIRFSRA